jgi:hypothetical protein
MKKLFLIGCLILMISCQGINSAPQIESTPPVNATATPTETATPAPTLTAIATATIPPTPIPLFFTEEFNTDLSVWTSFQTGGEQPALTAFENNSLKITMASPNTWYYAIHNAHEYSSVFVSAKFSATPDGSVGLICNYSEANGWYEYNVASNGTYSILFGQWLAEGIAQYQPITSNSSEYLQPGNLSYKIGMTCGENILLLHINDKMFRKIDVSRLGLTQGKIGITVSSFDAVPMETRFEWVKVSQPE